MATDPNIPNPQERNKYAAQSAWRASTQDMVASDDGYIESDLELKSSIILNPKAKIINPLNVSDLVLGGVTDKKLISQLQFWLELQVAFYEAGMLDTAQYYTNLILSTLNFRRSESGWQQKMLISRVQHRQLKLEEDRKPNRISNLEPANYQGNYS